MVLGDKKWKKHKDFHGFYFTENPPFPRWFGKCQKNVRSHDFFDADLLFFDMRSENDQPDSLLKVENATPVKNWTTLDG